MITCEQLKEIMSYDPDTGLFTATKNRTKRLEGVIRGNGKYRLSMLIYGKRYKAHRLAWLYMTGDWPKYEIDHANGDPHDNRWCNLRDATRSQNGMNKKASKNNTSGHKGVSRSGMKWAVQCTVNKKRHYLGRFDDLEFAAFVYEEFARTHHGEFFRI